MEKKIGDLLIGVKDGEALSFEAVLDLYKPLLYSIVLDAKSRFSIPESEIDDWMQEAAIALYHCACSFDDTKGVTFGLYAKICIRNRIISLIRRSYSGSLSCDSFEQAFPEDSVSSDFTPEQFVINKEALEELGRRLDESLTEFERSVFWLYLGGMSYTDISEALGKSKKAVDNAIVRMKAKLKKLL